MKIRKIGDVFQFNHGNGGLVFIQRSNGRALFNFYGIFGINSEMVIPGQHPQHFFSGFVLNPLHPISEQFNITPEAVDDKSLDHIPVSGRQALNGSHQLSKHSAPVDICHKDHIGTGIFSHPEIDNIRGHEIDFSTGTSPLHNYYLKAALKPVKGSARLIKIEILFNMIFHCGAVFNGYTVENHL